MDMVEFLACETKADCVGASSSEKIFSWSSGGRVVRVGERWLGLSADMKDSGNDHYDFVLDARGYLERYQSPCVEQ